MRAYDDFVDFLVQNVSLDALAHFEPSRDAKHRVEELKRRKESGKLSPEEKRELARFHAAEHILRLARERTQQRLASE